MALHKVHEPEQKPGFVIGQNKEHPRSQRISSRVHQAGSGFFQIYIWHTEISGSGPDCLKVRNQILQLAWSFRDMSCRLCPNSGHGLACIESPVMHTRAAMAACALHIHRCRGENVTVEAVFIKEVGCRLICRSLSPYRATAPRAEQCFAK